MPQQQDIRVLSETVANKIAAGEVVERPASALKELAENAVDAGATQIDVELAAGGRKLVAVSDNGAGLNRDNALLAIERHATSKIRDVDDIEHIDTLGFRGEALAAIASVSRFRLTTCRQGEVNGTEIVVSAGKLQDVNDIGCPAGTRIDVRDLFFNVPARRKFLRSQQTELTHLRNGFIMQALAHPEIGMSLRVDGRDLYRLPPGGADTLTDRLRDLFGADYLDHLRPVGMTHGAISIRGLVGLPAFNRGDRSEQYLFVNGRSTTAPLLGFAIRQGYHSLLPKDRHPVLFLFIDMDPGLVDVNVHPTKKEVRFRRPSEVRDALIAAIQSGLAMGARPPADAPSFDSGPPPRPTAAADVHLPIADLVPARTFKYPRLPMLSGIDAPQSAAAPPPSEHPASSDGTTIGPNADPNSSIVNPPPWSWCRVLGQVGDLYVVLEIEDGMVLMDPHAAHERVLYERFMAEFEAGSIPTQSLLVPETVALRPGDADRVRRNLDVLKRMGIGLAEFGGDTFVLDALPAFIDGVTGEALLVEIVRELEQAGARGARGGLKETAVMQAACKTAVKSRDALSLEEIERLVVDLARCEMPYTCPHGRPTLIHMAFRELNRKFGRGG